MDDPDSRAGTKRVDSPASPVTSCHARQPRQAKEASDQRSQTGGNEPTKRVKIASLLKRESDKHGDSSATLEVLREEGNKIKVDGWAHSTEANKLTLDSKEASGPVLQFDNGSLRIGSFRVSAAALGAVRC